MVLELENSPLDLLSICLVSEALSSHTWVFLKKCCFCCFFFFLGLHLKANPPQKTPNTHQQYFKNISSISNRICWLSGDVIGAGAVNSKCKDMLVSQRFEGTLPHGAQQKCSQRGVICGLTVKFLLNIMLEYKVNITQENAIWNLSFSM